MSMDSAAPETGADALSPPHGDGEGERERSRSPRKGMNPPTEAETDKNKDLKDQIVQELLTNLLDICPAVTVEEATPSKLLQSNLSLGVATVGLTARLNTVILGLQKTQDSLQTMGTSMVQSNLMLAKTLKDQAVSIESQRSGA